MIYYMTNPHQTTKMIIQTILPTKRSSILLPTSLVQSEMTKRTGIKFSGTIYHCPENPSGHNIIDLKIDGAVVGLIQQILCFTPDYVLLFETPDFISKEDYKEMADIPGIIEGAHLGKGLGLRFLRHIERNSVLLFMIAADSNDIHAEYKVLLNELKQYNPELLHKDRLLAISKSDMLDDQLKEDIRKDLPNIPSIFISSVAEFGLVELKDMIWESINNG